tara:strand:+ start:3262 stop:3723 length:462 start_codon:yes stop_codon:yes gene_type:complete
MWFSGSGENVTLQQILEKTKEHSFNNGTIFVGCDSQITRESCVYSTVICMHGADDQHGGYYFFKREKNKRNDYPTMVMRLLREVELSIEIGYTILEQNPEADIEIHIDANSKKDKPTGRFADMLMGYAKGAGFRCKIKPDAWASNSIADKHSK